MEYKKPLKRVFRKLKEILTPPPDLKISEWANTYRFLSGESSPERGKYNAQRAAYQIEMMDAFCDPKIEMVVGMLPAQTGKSTIIENVMGYFAHQDPKPMLLVQPTQGFAETFSKDRLAPMIRDTPVLRTIFVDPKSRNSDNTLTHKKFTGGFWAMVGANSPMDLAGRPVPVVMMDEIDRYPDSAGSEGSPIEIGTKRASNFWNKKLGLFSTPTDELTSKVSHYYSQSDQRKYYVNCPHCNHSQILEFPRLKYQLDEEGDVKEESVFYQCVSCTDPITSNFKNRMIQSGQWIASRPTGKIAGFWINALYSPWITWQTICQEFQKSKDNPMKYKTFVNTRLCEVWKESGEKPDWEHVYAKRESYKRGTVPKGGILLVAGADVQHDRIEVEIVAYGKNLESWSVDYRVLLGNTANEEVWRDLTTLLNEDFYHENGLSMKIKKMAVDSSDGQRSAWVYAWARSQGPKRVMAIKGSSLRQTTMISTPKAQDFDFQGKKYQNGVYLTIVGTEIIKFELYSQVKLKKHDDGLFPHGYTHFPDYPESFFKMLLAEEIRMKRLSNGGHRYEFFCPNGMRNEALDCRVYARAAGTSLMMDHFTNHHWERLESIILKSPDPKTIKKIQREENPQPNQTQEKKSITVGFHQSQNQPKKTYKPASRPIT